jgi:putative transposase
MKPYLSIFLEFLRLIALLLRPGGYRAIAAENLILKHQLIVHSRAHKRVPKLSALDRALFGFWTAFLSPRRLIRAAILIKPSTLLRFHSALVKKKYRLLYSSQSRQKPGPKEPTQAIINAVVAMKQRNPKYGCPRIAQQINLAFGLEIDKDVVRRILAKYYRPLPGNEGPSWLSMLGHAKDSLWSVDIFRCESILLKNHWVMVVMDQFTRRIIGFGVTAGDVNGPTLCRMFNEATAKQPCPRYLSSDNDPLFEYHRWKAHMRVLDIEEIKSVPYAPMSHPFVERLIGSIRQELLDQVFFWNSTDLQRKLDSYREYFNAHRTHTGRNGLPPAVQATRRLTNLAHFSWQLHCRGLFQLPAPA